MSGDQHQKLEKRIFISYATENRSVVEPLAHMLTKAGYGVWWDQQIPGGVSYEKRITAALNNADIVIVAWSKDANKSDWVKDEAGVARDTSKLIPISIDGELPPLGFRQYNAIDLSAWNGSSDSAGFQQLQQSITAHLDHDAADMPGQFQESVTEPIPVTTRQSYTIALLVGLVAVIAGVFALRNSGEVQNVEPLVIVMDSAHPARIYDDSVKAAGATNADILSDILSDLPIRTQKELISPEWHRDEVIAKFRPTLILIHYSGFRQEDGSGERTRLKSLIEYFSDTETKFLIYSRAREAWLTDNMSALLTDLYAKHPDLESRVQVFGLLEYGGPHWEDRENAQKIKLRIKDVLALKN